MPFAEVPTDWRDVVRRNERRLASLWIVAVLLLLAVMAIRPTRVRVLGLLQTAADTYDDRWDRRLSYGAQLVEKKRFVEAETYLEKLDAEYPARTNRHGRDKEREYLLRLLAQSYEQTGHKAHAMATWKRLIAFDSLNYRNRFGYAQAAERLLSGWALAPEARDGYSQSLSLLPTHLPSLRGYIAYYNDRSEWREIVAAYRAYLDAFLREEVDVRIGDSTRTVSVLVDGRTHDVSIPLSVPAGWQGDVVIRSTSYPIAVERVTVTPATAVGSMAPRAPRDLPLDALSASHMSSDGPAWVPQDSTALLRLPVAAGSTGVASVSIRLRLFKLMDAPLWDIVTKCYRNLMDAPGLTEAQSRTVTYPTANAAQAAFDRLEWTHGGQYVPGTR